MQNYEILSLAGLRIDGRKHDELRLLRHRFGSCNSSDGPIGTTIGMGMSDGWVYLEQGLNKVLVMVHGPQEPRKRSNTDQLGENKVQ